MKRKFIKIVATFFFVGYLPLAPGTWASLACAALYFLVRHDFYLAFGAFVAVFLLGLYTAGRSEEILGKKDDGKIVIDEVCGILALFISIPPQKLYLITGFVLFRLFDALKPYPAGRCEKLPGSWGIMADDLIAALYAYLIITIVAFVAGYLR